MSANQLRLYFSSFAYVPTRGLRRLGLQGTELEKAPPPPPPPPGRTTIRLKLLQIGARITVSVRRLLISFSQSYPFAQTFDTILISVQTHLLWRPFRIGGLRGAAGVLLASRKTPADGYGSSNNRTESIVRNSSDS